LLNRPSPPPSPKTAEVAKATARQGVPWRGLVRLMRFVFWPMVRRSRGKGNVGGWFQSWERTENVTSGLLTSFTGAPLADEVDAAVRAQVAIVSKPKGEIRRGQVVHLPLDAGAFSDTPRRLRLEYPGAICRVINRGNCRADVFRGEDARAAFEAGRRCARRRVAPGGTHARFMPLAGPATGLRASRLRQSPDLCDALPETAFRPRNL
jgi:hypothetical protein